jgi:hypothetical protein
MKNNMYSNPSPFFYRVHTLALWLHSSIALAEPYLENKNVTGGWRKNDELLQMYYLSNVGRAVKWRRRWAGKIAHLEGMVNVYNILVRKHFGDLDIDNINLDLEEVGCDYGVGTFGSLLQAGFLLGLFFDLKMEATCSFKRSVDFWWTTLHYIPEDRTLHNHHCENLKSDKFSQGANTVIIPPIKYKSWISSCGKRNTI